MKLRIIMFRIACICAFIQFAGCTTYRSIVTLSPTETAAKEWRNGEETAIKSTETGTIALSYAGERYGRLLFSAEIISADKTPITVDPAQISCTAIRSKKNWIIPADDPEQHIKELERNIAKNEDDLADYELFGASSEDINERRDWITSEKEDLSFWKNETLRKNTLRKGQRIKGYLTFALNNEARELIIRIPFGDKILEFKYDRDLKQIP